ncbi:MAG: Fur family transcriptional regulator [Planctomycetota bacterium]
MNREQIEKMFAHFLRERTLKLTAQRRRILAHAFGAGDHFSAETLYDRLRQEEGPRISRATVYRTLGLLVEGGFLGALDVRRGEKLYEHVLGRAHHDHLVCIDCGRIEEFSDAEIERLQREACRAAGWEMADHNLRLFGVCPACQAARDGQAGAPPGR